MEPGQIVQTKRTKGGRASQVTALYYWNRYAYTGRTARNGPSYYERKERAKRNSQN